ncbi:lipid A hydroxylase LpxO [Herminiimonas arsenitoxidans]|uniref:lipid A hydroxylase LpxO n=1 Tax=Herminiimonas arsenitoxidans TaxID=1809410 RepID=UPI0018D46AF7|nr:lipid A hydroxylase LpxO [Herminiimonas arsenitoxidans]
MKWTLISLFICSVLYTHYRGKVRHKWLRQSTDHSTFMAPINAFMTLFSPLPDRPYHDLNSYPEMKALADQWEVIRDEAVALQDKIKASDNMDDAGFNSFFRRGWTRFYLKWYGESHPSAMQSCPRTVAILDSIPIIKAAMFAQLPPGADLGKHRDPYAGSLRYHLGLATPNDDRCFIDVDGVRYSWRDGEAVIFDETYIHWAANESDKNRIILFCDLERKMKWRWAQAFNQWFSRTVMASTAAPNDMQDRTGGLNRAFRHIYAIRANGKKLKARNKPLYYIVKWSILLAIVGGILMI